MESGDTDAATDGDREHFTRLQPADSYRGTWWIKQTDFWMPPGGCLQYTVPFHANRTIKLTSCVISCDGGPWTLMNNQKQVLSYKRLQTAGATRCFVPQRVCL